MSLKSETQYIWGDLKKSPAHCWSYDSFEDGTSVEEIIERIYSTRIFNNDTVVKITITNEEDL